MKAHSVFLLAVLLALDIATLQVSPVKAEPDASFSFGFEGTYTNSFTATNCMIGTNFTFIDNVETQVKLVSITFAHSAQHSFSEKIKYALYNSTLGLIASTEEYYGTESSRTLFFTSPYPILTNNTVYWLVAWGTYWHYYYTPATFENSMSFNLTQTYTGDFPAALSPSSYTNTTWHIYGTYSTQEELMDSYPKSNWDGWGYGLADLHPSDSVYSSAAGQTFKVTQGDMKLTKVQFYLGYDGSPTGTDAKAVIYETTGTHGVNATPTGTALAESESFNVEKLQGGGKVFTFKFFNGLTLKNNTVYAVVFQVPTSGTVDTSNYIGVNGDQTDPTHDGNSFRYKNGTWDLTYAGRDVIFYVYGYKWMDIGGFAITAPQVATAYSSEYFLLNATVRNDDGVAYLRNATLELSHNVILAWVNSTNTFNILYDPNGYCSIDEAGCSRTTLNTSAYRLSWKIMLSDSYPHGLVDVKADNTKVYDVNNNSRTNSQTGLFTLTKRVFSPTEPPPREPPPPYIPPTPEPPKTLPQPEFQYGVMILVGIVVVAFIAGLARIDKRSSETKLQRKWRRKVRRRGT